MEATPLTTPQIADACLRLGLEPRLAPAGLRAVLPGVPLQGPVRPVRHFGSVDIFLEAMTLALPGEILVVDNGGRLDEGCVGDLTALEARSSGLAGLVVWGVHRDHEELRRIAFPVYSYGTCPCGPRRLDARAPGALEGISFGSLTIDARDWIYADEDGAVFVAEADNAAVQEAAAAIRATERQQAGRIEAGENLRQQLRFSEYLERRNQDPDFSFRQFLREIGGAIEE